MVRGISRCFWMGEPDHVGMQSNLPRGVWGHASPGNIFYVYALESIPVHSDSETNIINMDP